MTTADFPTPEDDDPEDIVLALETGSALWKNGKADEAVRWLRRAADSAEQAGKDLRALMLARAAAELVAPEGSAPPPSRAAAPDPSRPPPPPSRRSPPSTSGAEPTAAASRPPPPSASRAPAPPSAAPAAPPTTSHAQHEPAPSAPPNSPVESGEIDLTKALRVSIKQSARDEALYVARLLDDGSAPPPGSRRALVILLDDTG